MGARKDGIGGDRPDPPVESDGEQSKKSAALIWLPLTCVQATSAVAPAGPEAVTAAIEAAAIRATTTIDELGVSDA